MQNMSFTLRININDGSAKGFMIHADESVVARVLRQLRESWDSLESNPLAFLNIIFADHGQSCEDRRADLDNDVASIERRTGKTSLPLFSHDFDMDHERLNEDLHACNTNLIFLDNVTNFEMSVGKFIKDTYVKFAVLRHEMGIASTSNYESLSQDTDCLINVCEMRRYQAQSLHRRLQSQINVVSKS